MAEGGDRDPVAVAIEDLYRRVRELEKQERQRSCEHCPCVGGLRFDRRLDVVANCCKCGAYVPPDAPQPTPKVELDETWTAGEINALWRLAHSHHQTEVHDTYSGGESGCRSCAALRKLEEAYRKAVEREVVRLGLG